MKAPLKAEVVLIAGPTASGKSAAALALAEAIGGAIINADSMQIYREMRVLTARPSETDERRVPHRLFGHVGVRELYSVGRYRSDAAGALAQVRAGGLMPIFVGGTGLYFAALMDGIADIPSVPARVRERTRARLEAIGNEAFHAELALRDQAMARVLRASDRQRMLRAYEVLEATGRSLSHWQRTTGQPVLGDLRAARFVLDVPRPLLRARIDARFHDMLARGAGGEAVGLADLDPKMPAARILGVRELIAARKGLMSEADAVARAVTLTRQYAKRQMTWFRRRMADWQWIDGTKRNLIADMMEKIV